MIGPGPDKNDASLKEVGKRIFFNIRETYEEENVEMAPLKK